MNTKPLSDKWWNVNRRKMTATPVTYDGEEPLCPDCGDETHLMNGKFGRFYKCNAYPCEGTIGARPDGTPRFPKADPETTAAREAARDAVRRLIDTFEVKAAKENVWSCIVSEVFTLLRESTDMTLFAWTPHHTKGLFIRKKTREEARELETLAIRLRAEIESGAYFTRLAQDDLLEQAG